MRTFSNKIFNETQTADVVAQTPGVATPGNLNNGVMNHYIPIQNIVINVRNLFGSWWGLVVEPGEDNQTLKIYNSQFTSEEAVWKILSYAPDGRTSLMDYVSAQGLPHVRMVNLGSVFVVYFYATDIAGQQDPATFATTGDNVPATATCDKCVTDDIAKTETCECEISDLSNFITESSDDEQKPLFYSGEVDLEDPLYRTIREVVNMSDKVRACGQWIKLLGDHITLPDGYYWKAVKDRDGVESIALRKKFVKRRPFGQTMDCVKSLMNIYNADDDGIWVGVFDHKDRLDKEEQELLDNILSYIQAQPSTDPCVFGVKQPVEDANESLSAEDHNKLFVVYDEFGAMIRGFQTEEEAKEFADAWSKEYHVDCKVEKNELK